MFIDPFGKATAVEHIVRTRRMKGGKIDVELTNGDTCLLDQAEFDSALRNTVRQMVPALPGTYLLSAQHYEGEFSVWRTPVVAWAVSADGFVWPVTHEGVGGEDGGEPPVLYPDGQVISLHVHFRDYAAWERQAREELEKRQERTA